MRKKLYRLGLILLIISMVLIFSGACTPVAEESASPAETPTLPLEVVDQAGRVVKIDKIPEKIISLAPGNTEIIYALELQDRLVGVTEFCDYPEAVKDKPKIGGFSTVDIERVVEIQPDLILAANIHKDEAIPTLEGLGLTVITLDPKSIDEVLQAINLIGNLTGKKDEASQLVTEIMNRVKSVTDRTAPLSDSQRPRVFYILWHDPLMTAGSGTRIHELIAKAGGINIAHELAGDYPTISLEAVILANPQVIVAGSGHGTGKDLPYQFALTEARLKDVDARQNARVYEIDGDLTSRPGPRIVDGLEKFAEFIHPELFKEAR